MRRLVGVFALVLFPALAQGYEVGAFGLGGQTTSYLRLFGAVPVEGGRLFYALAPYLRMAPGEGGLAVERLYLAVEVGEVGLTLGRFPYTFGEGRLFPYTWNAPSPAGGVEGVWGGFLTLYGEARLRLGYAWGPGGFAEAAWGDLKALVFPGGVGLAGSARLGEVVVYGETMGLASGPRGLLGWSWAWGPGEVVLEAAYPLGVGLGWFGQVEGLGLSLRLAYGGGWSWGVGLGWEGLRVEVGKAGPVWRWGGSWSGEF
ncbi:hypothetical protein [Thermus thermamylovorans]|uniref:Uncharacterized protein n=1 Tax=Thermus thermamylovorans TaxID=2509362 RepID=A0A4Q9B7Z0_9DEIN|nr:hypothetical protein [Thermus thermamylovorans]TBH21941.1 hypothetical protein ETP66_01515 [Thermus thermamylovorans]